MHTPGISEQAVELRYGTAAKDEAHLLRFRELELIFKESQPASVCSHEGELPVLEASVDTVEHIA